MAKIKIIAPGLGSVPQQIREMAEALGGEVVGMDDACDCVPCTMRRDFEAKYPGRSPLHHPSLNIVTDDQGNVEVNDVIRHRLFKDNRGNTMFFNSLLHPADELNLYVCEMERMAVEYFGVEPLVGEDGGPVYQTVDFRTADVFVLENVQGVMHGPDNRQVSITAIAGPDFDRAVQARISQAH